jgi:hypothetical protein
MESNADESTGRRQSSHPHPPLRSTFAFSGNLKQQQAASLAACHPAYSRPEDHEGMGSSSASASKPAGSNTIATSCVQLAAESAKALHLKGQFVVGDFSWSMGPQTMGQESTAAASAGSIRGVTGDNGSLAVASVPRRETDNAKIGQPTCYTGTNSVNNSSPIIRRLAVFLGSPIVESLVELVNHGLTLYNLPIQDR